MHGNNGVQLDEALQRRVQEFAQAKGASEAAIVKEAIEEYLAIHTPETLFDRAQRAGLVGCLPGTPHDLSTNKDHFEGFGRG